MSTDINCGSESIYSSPYFLTHTVFTNELSPLRKETNIVYAFMVCIRKDFWVEGRKKLVEHCHSDMHELGSTIQEFSGGEQRLGIPRPPPLYEPCALSSLNHKM